MRGCPVPWGQKPCHVLWDRAHLHVSQASVLGDRALCEPNRDRTPHPGLGSSAWAHVPRCDPGNLPGSGVPTAPACASGGQEQVWGDVYVRDLGQPCWDGGRSV